MPDGRALVAHGTAVSLAAGFLNWQTINLERQCCLGSVYWLVLEQNGGNKSGFILMAPLITCFCL